MGLAWGDPNLYRYAGNAPTNSQAIPSGLQSDNEMQAMEHLRRLIGYTRSDLNKVESRTAESRSR